VSAAKDRGTRAESAVVQYLIDQGWPHTERRAGRGTSDAGDISGFPGLIIEVKDHRQLRLAEWVLEAERERANCKAEYGVVWHKKVGKGSPNDWYVTMTGETFVRLLRQAGW
jgi:hypothetical protein